MTVIALLRRLLRRDDHFYSAKQRQMISERTKAGLARARAQGRHPGRPSGIPAELRERIRAMRASGVTLAAIADQLDRDGIATGQSGRAWWPSTVANVLKRDEQAP